MENDAYVFFHIICTNASDKYLNKFNLITDNLKHYLKNNNLITFIWLLLISIV